jgi:hypothetical protein
MAEELTVSDSDPISRSCGGDVAGSAGQTIRMALDA